ncbi:hypothetical protein [uncultured Paludibaculum sp.]|uniref:hypothetical protein n=1 Tax=uncultured Paludibaculum sp. TaxID=1765020 RepID=UPI002AAB4E87|nr:hypothetical protein [uncultured Paludibaculum sp.]
MNISLFRRNPASAVVARNGAGNRFPSLEYPLSPRPRIAVLGLAVRPETGIYVLPEWTSADLIAARPCALAGWFRELEQLGRLCQSGRLTLEHLSFPLVVFSTPEDGPLSEADHDRLWNWFQLPVFEQIRARDGRLIAVECDRRAGFHACYEDGHPNGVELCTCGAARQWTPSYERTMAAAAGD